MPDTRDGSIFSIAPACEEAYPGVAAGVLAMRAVANPEQHPALEARKAELETELRARFGSQERGALAALPAVRPYVAYYARFRKTYHVLLQLESVALKGKSLPRVAALVECMFMAELASQLLTAGHDLAAVDGAAQMRVATGDERYVLLGGQEQQLKPGDLYIADTQGVLSSIVYGPDRRTRIVRETRAALFTVYAPPGVPRDALEQHLQLLEALVRLVAPDAETLERAVRLGTA